MGPPAWRALGAGLAVTLLCGFAWAGASKLPRNPSDSELEFLSRHWRRPIAPQGVAPDHFSPLERSLAPSDCGSCHPAQLADWKTSLHSRSMGPGVAGQLAEMARSDPGSVRACLQCHAPLAEQSAKLREGDALVDNPAYDAGLHSQGIVCAGCHVRGNQRFGPPARPGRPAAVGPRAHDGFAPSSAFLRSEFCASCHQFTPGGLSLNGKLLENTYEEWRASPAARRGEQCQDCHMPDRRHLWRGIHDPDMVKSGVRVTLDLGRPRHRVGDRLAATLTVASTGVGHYFPTYVTPKVVVRVELIDREGRAVADSVEERAIGREVTLDLSRELADTRIPPGGRFRLAYARALDRAGMSLRATVTVLPDEFYTRFFETLLEAGAGVGQTDIAAALEATRRSPYTIYRREIPLT